MLRAFLGGMLVTGLLLGMTWVLAAPWLRHSAMLAAVEWDEADREEDSAPGVDFPVVPSIPRPGAVEPTYARRLLAPPPPAELPFPGMAIGPEDAAQGEESRTMRVAIAATGGIMAATCLRNG